ncbi:MAG: hypothetical protein ABIJ43_03025 [Candidatus Beckwithbacteria bacterium]|nr:hypothetical protein [Patescibacteria group bacterium]
METQLFVSGIFRKKVEGLYVYLDNDFLSALFKDEELLKQVNDVLSGGNLLIDPFTKFEFLRGTYIPKEVKTSKDFIEQPGFITAPNRQEIFLKIQENALLLSTIYSHKNISKKKNSGGLSIVDLFLAGRLMLNWSKTVLITGNKKDFPRCVFDVLGVINFEQEGDGSMRVYSLVQFSKEKFESCYGELKKIEKVKD